MFDRCAGTVQVPHKYELVSKSVLAKFAFRKTWKLQCIKNNSFLKGTCTYIPQQPSRFAQIAAYQYTQTYQKAYFKVIFAISILRSLNSAEGGVPRAVFRFS